MKSNVNPLILSGQNLGKQIQNQWLWRNLNFELLSGEQVAVVGASGSGKSLLLRAIAHLDSIQSGQFLFLGKPINSPYIPRYRSQVIYLHQRPALWEGTVEDNLKQVYRLAIHRHQVYNQQLILDYLQLLHKPANFLQRPVSAISGGEAQIVAFLRALQLSPLVLLLDEPTASLDAETVHCLEALVTTWQKQNPERAYLWTSHDPTQLERVTSREIQIKENK
ncbi:ABC transporter ATP-binding protein [Trichormus variabilis]|uniref:ABC transporter ATP-binding protein n=1 Tax=Trichormus variabilis SAG 1403-4b TaxID=447716 RepID=A0A433UYV9_ANAVA|nr:ATP-binding cassette domain-containing protein [Trichormus variabilis]MBD2625738.1 ATP-binding cassette domain-containing protein [Trichormus variabilis FACHB-164]RUS99023.1 ABC transporter ATP-binding protein [Trichormus variabilis SAG 1403-4b]